MSGQPMEVSIDGRILKVQVLRLPATLFCVDEDAPTELIQRDLDALYFKKEHAGEIALVDADTQQGAALVTCNLDVYYGAIAVRDRNSHSYVVVRACRESPFQLGQIVKHESVKRPHGRNHDLLLS